jgi:hypothetical protein
VIANPTSAVETALNVGVSPNEYAVSDFEGLQMLKADAGSDADPVSEALAAGAPDRPAHQGLEIGITSREARIQIRQARRIVGFG